MCFSELAEVLPSWQFGSSDPLQQLSSRWGMTQSRPSPSSKKSGFIRPLGARQPAEEELPSFGKPLFQASSIKAC